MIRYPTHLLTLIQVLKRLPGVGSKSAERYAFHLLSLPKTQVEEIAKVMEELHSKLSFCPNCGCLIEKHDCPFCRPERKEQKVLCVIGNVKDAFALEETREYSGLYHVLPALFSPLEGYGPDQLRIDLLEKRVEKEGIQEIIIALDSTLEGDATALFIKEAFLDKPVRVTRLAFGLPMGSSLDYIDGGTLAKAFLGRA